MGAFNAFRNAMLKHAFGGPNYTRPATVYAALFTSAPSVDSAGTEVTGGSYARVAITNTDDYLLNDDDGVTSNVEAIQWPQATADWGLIVAVALFDAPTGGNGSLFGAMTPTVTIINGDLFAMAAGQMRLVAS